MAEKPVPQQYRKAYQDMTGGLMSRPNPLQIPANKFKLLQNAILNDRDVLQKVQGYVLDGSPFPNSSDSFIRMLINYKIGSNISTLVCAALDAGNTNANYKVDLKQSYGDGNYAYIGHTVGTAQFTNASAAVVGTGTAWTHHLKAGDKIGTSTSIGVAASVWYEILSVNSDTSITLTGTYAGTTTTSTFYMARIVLNANNIPVGVVFNNNLIISNGSETPMESNNTSISLLQSTNWPTVKILELHKNRVFGANWPASPSGLMWTYANDETTVDATSRATIFANDNGQVVQIKSFANSLVIFKDNGNIYQVVGEFDQSAAGQPALVRKIDSPDNVGVISGKSICILEDNTGVQGYQRLGSKIYFLSETGIYTINSYMQVQKVSWDIQPTLANLLLKSTATATKQYPYTSKSQWDGGTLNSLSDTRLLNGISTFFDSQSISNVLQQKGCAGTFIDSSNDIHTAYISSDGLSIRYNHWLASDNTNLDSQVVKAGVDASVPANYASASAVCISKAANGNIGIVSRWRIPDGNASPGGGGPGLAYFLLSEFASGSWTHYSFYQTIQTDENPQGHGVKFISYRVDNVGMAIGYDGSSNPYIAIAAGNSSTSSGGVTFYNGTGITYFKRNSGVWSIQTLFANNTDIQIISMKLDSSNNIYIFGADSGSGVHLYKSTNGGATFSNPNNITVAGSSPTIGVGAIDIEFTNLQDPILVYNFTGGSGGDVGKTVRYNTTSSTSTYIVNATNVLLGYGSNVGLVEFYYGANSSGYEQFILQSSYQSGTAIFTSGSATVTGTATKWTTWIAPGDKMKVLSDEEIDYATVLTVDSDNSITLTAPYGGTTQLSPANYISRKTTTVTNTGTFILSVGAFTSMAGLSANANVVATAVYGPSSGQLFLRRVTLFGQWYSSILSDSSLTAWSTYTVTGSTSNGNTLLFEVGVSSGNAMPDNQMFPVIPGSIISSTYSDIYVKGRISFTLGNFAAASVQSLTMNYVATGVDGKLPFAYVYNNEMYLSVTTPSGSANNEIVFLDRVGAWGLFTQGSCAMARYNQQLYVGDTTSGKIFKFRQGYDFNGSAYSLIAITKEDLLGSIELQKEIYKVYVIYETQLNGTFDFSYRFDNFLNPNSSDTTGWVDTTIDQTKGSVYEITGMAGQKCSSIQFKVQQDDADVQVGIVGFIILYDYYGIR